MTAAHANRVEQYLGRLEQMQREELVRELLHYDGRTRLDFTPEYLEGLSLNALRHLLHAVVLNVPPA